MGAKMEFDEWVKFGVDQGWCSYPVCSTHSGIPYTAAEDAEWDEGLDPCAHVIRLFESREDQQDAVGSRLDG